MLAHLAAGRLPRPHVPRARRPSERDPKAPAPPLPRAWAWLVRKIGYQAAGFGSQLQTLLYDPAMLTVLQAAPTAGRTLRPFCRLLGVDLPPALRMPPRPEKPRPVVASPVRPPRPPRPAMLPLAPQRKPRPLPFLPPFVKFRRTGNA